MNERIENLIKLAKVKHGDDITPCPQFDSFYESVTIDNDKLILWYNCPMNSTHIVIEHK